jgi:hypothetical protein
MRGFRDDGAEVNEYHQLCKQDFVDLLKGHQLQDPKRLQNLQRLHNLQRMAEKAATLPCPTGPIRL